MKKRNHRNLHSLCGGTLCLLMAISFTACDVSSQQKNPEETLRALLSEKDTSEKELEVFYKNHPINFEFSEQPYNDVTVATLDSQEGYEELVGDVKHTFLHVMLSDKTPGKSYPLYTIDLIAEPDWQFSPNSEATLIAQHEDKLLIELWYGPGRSASIIYSIGDDSHVELMPNSRFSAYRHYALDGSEPYILAESVTYDIGSYGPLTWYDWDGNILRKLEHTQDCFHGEDFCYLIRDDSNGLLRYDFYSANLDGTDAKRIATIQEGYPDTDLIAFFWEDKELKIGYQWRNKNGDWIEKEIPFFELRDITINE